MKLHPDVQALATVMRALEAHLRRHEASHWADHIARCLEWIEASDAYGLSRFLALFGGMGSINDLVLQKDGNALANENEDLQSLLDRAYELADRLRREAGI